ncbi:MAG: DUF1302 family protein [Proteobacteria bacterium]|nr:DUF1302 family protein [Pseudomonadota bacterium]
MGVLGALRVLSPCKPLQARPRAGTWPRPSYARRPSVSRINAHPALHQDAGAAADVAQARRADVADVGEAQLQVAEVLEVGAQGQAPLVAAHAGAAAFNTNHGLALSGTLALSYPGVFEGWDLSVPISLSRQLQGRTLTGGVGGEGDTRGSIGANFTYNCNFQIGLTCLGYFGKAETVDQKKINLLTDRDPLSLVMKYSF